jgi:hypothetical protein
MFWGVKSFLKTRLVAITALMNKYLQSKVEVSARVNNDKNKQSLPHLGTNLSKY